VTINLLLLLSGAGVNGELLSTGEGRGSASRSLQWCEEWERGQMAPRRDQEGGVLALYLQVGMV
jgi:hypothetical protein